MSRSNRMCQTETALNVSQDYETPARSSPPASTTAAAVAYGDSVLVEDSMGAKGKVPAADEEVVEDSVENGAVKASTAQTKRPAQGVGDDHDELYSLTPERPRGNAARKPARAPQPAEAQHRGNMNAVDALLMRGATVHKSKQTPSEVEQAPAAIQDTDDFGRPQRGTSASLDTTASKKPAVPAKNVPAKVQNPTNATGSLAALRIRRGQDPAGTGGTPIQSAMSNVLQPRDANAQIPAMVSMPASGKLKPRKGGMFARIPVTATMNGSQTAASGKLQAKANGRSPNEQSNIAVKSAQKPASKLAVKTSEAKPAARTATMEAREATLPVPQSTQKPSEEQKSLKRLAKDMKDDGDEDESMYDVPQSESGGEGDEDENEYRPTKKARKREQCQPKRKAAKSSAVVSPAPVKKVARKSKGKATKLSSDVGAQDEPIATASGTSTRARMKAFSGVAAPKSKPKMSAKPAKQPADGQKDRGSSSGNATDAGTLDTGPVPNIRPASQRPETPVAIRSSPPVDGRTSTRPTTAGVVDTTSARKPTVIAFGKSGPRNQGTSAQRNHGQGHDKLAVTTDDDGFANVDDFGGDTILVDDQGSAPEAVDPVQSARTISQKQMPPPKSKEKPKIVNVAPVVPSMVQPEQQKSGSASHAIIEGNNSQRPFRRQKSQGTVDIHGSPVPEGMVIGGLNTVLETFSQQAGLSSDKFVEDGQGKDKPAGKISSERSHTKPHRAPARLSSNTKPVPAEPSQESQAITHVARVPKGGQFVQGHIAHPPTDPFTSSAEERKRKGKGSSSSAFSKHFRQQVVQVTEATKAMQALQAQQQDEQEEYEAMEDEEEDPEKTLVEAGEEEEEPASPAHRHSKTKPKSKPQRLASSSSSDSSFSSTSSADDHSYKDLGKWRLALKPHQLSLFDSLVAIAHRLTAHLASREEAERNIVDDYRRRGKALVQSLQAGRAKDVEGFVREFEKRKRDLGREMDGEGGRVARAAQGVRVVRKDVKERAKVRNAGRGEGNVEGEGLRGIMEGYC